MAFENRPNMIISKETTYSHCHCTVCGDRCASDPNYCERHREPRQFTSTFKFRNAVILLGRREPALGADIILEKIDIEGYASQVRVSMELYPARKISMKKGQMAREYRKMVIKTSHAITGETASFTVTPALMFIDKELLDGDAYGWKRRYSVRIEGETVEVRK